MIPFKISTHGRGNLVAKLHGSDVFGNAAWTSNPNMNRFIGPWLFAPTEPGITPGIAAVGTGSSGQPTYDTRTDVYINGNIHLTTPGVSLPSTSIQIGGGKKTVIRGITIAPAGSSTGGKMQALKAPQHLHVEGIYGDFGSTVADSDGLVTGGCNGAVCTSSINGLYWTITSRSTPPGPPANGGNAGDIIIGGSLTGTNVLANTLIADFGKCNAIGSISGTTLTTTSESGAPISGISTEGMQIEIDGGIVVGRVTGGSAGTYTITNSSGISVPAGSRIFIYSTGKCGSYLVNQSHSATGTQSITFNPPTAGYYGVPPDVPADRVAEVALSRGPVITRQSNRIENTHGTNLCKYVYNGVSGSGVNSGNLSDARMTGTQNCQITLTGPIVASGTSKGAWTNSTAYSVGDVVTNGGRSWVCRTTHTSPSTGTTIVADRQKARWVAPNTAVVGWYPMGAWVTGTAYLICDIITQGGKMYMCVRDHTASAAFSTDLSSKWTDLTGATAQSGYMIKITNTGYNSGSGLVNAPLGDFNRDWRVVSATTTGNGTSGTILNLVCDNSFNSNLPASGAIADVATYAGQAIFMGIPLNSTQPIDGNEAGEHADSMGQTDKDKYIAFLGTDLCLGTSDYQSGGITSNSIYSDSTEEFSRYQLSWVLGIMPGEDASCNIVWSGMQSYVVTKRKRYWQCWIDPSARPWVTPIQSPFPNASLRATSTNVSYSNGTDAATSRTFLSYGSGVYSGGWLVGAPVGGDVIAAARLGFAYSTNSPYSYYKQRDPDASEMLSLSFRHDTSDTLMTASPGTHIGWFDLTCSPNFPGAIANGDRCIVDPVPTVNFVSLGRPNSNNKALRGRQSTPLGNNPFYVDCTVRGTSITKRFGPYNAPGAPSTTTTTLARSALKSAINTSPSSSTTLTIGTNDTGVVTDQIIGVVVVSTSGAPRTISEVRNTNLSGTLATLLGVSTVQKTDVATTVIAWYKLDNLAIGAGANVFVKTSGTPTSVGVFTWFVQGVGTTYDTTTAAGVGTGIANVPLTTAINQAPGGMTFALHSFSNLSTGGDRYISVASSVNNTAGNVTVGGSSISGGVMTWTGLTKDTDATIATGGTGSAVMSLISLTPSISLQANMIKGTLSNGTITQSGTYFGTDAADALVSSSPNALRWEYSLGILKGLRVEPTRQNILLNSTTFTGSGWVNSTGSPSLTGNTLETTAPNGSSSATLWARTVTASTFTSQTVAKAASSLPYTASFFVKKKSGRYLALRTQGTYPSRADVVFDLQSGIVSTAASTTGGFSNASATITPFANSWYRVTLTATTDTATTIGTYFNFNSNGTAVDVSDSVATSDGYVWGAQGELASTVSSYIQTTSTAVTRAADVLNITSAGKADGTYTARCWHQSGDYTDVTGVVVTSGVMNLTGISHKPVQGVTLF